MVIISVSTNKLDSNLNVRLRTAFINYVSRSSSINQSSEMVAITCSSLEANDDSPDSSRAS